MARQDWSVENVNDWEILHAVSVEREISEALAWYLLDIGIGRITEANLPEIMTRIRQVEEVCGAKLRLPDGNGGLPLTPIHMDSVRRRIGMWANVTPRTKTVFKKLIDKERADKVAHELRYGKAVTT